MKEFLIGSLIGMASGLVVGGIMVARNKKLSNKINDGINSAEQKIEQAKQTIAKKLEGCKCGENVNSQPNFDPNSNICC